VSVLDNAIGGTLSILGDALAPYAYIGGNSRSIGTIIPDIVVTETHHDETVITEHPVEKSASISDHAYDRPAELEMLCGFSNSTAQSEGYVQSVYAELLALRAQHEPFDVSTGKRQYSNMLIHSLSVTTDETSENALNITVGLREVIIVSTQTTNTSNSNQANPANTASGTDGGTKSLNQTNGVPTFAQITGGSTTAGVSGAGIDALGPSTSGPATFSSQPLDYSSANTSTGGIVPSTGIPGAPAPGEIIWNY
jgi:hypothetical protein